MTELEKDRIVNDVVKTCKESVRARELLTGELLSILGSLFVLFDGTEDAPKIKTNNYDMITIKTTDFSVMSKIAKHFKSEVEKVFSDVIGEAYMKVRVSDNVWITSNFSKLPSEIKVETRERIIRERIVDDEITPWFAGENSEDRKNA